MSFGLSAGDFIAVGKLCWTAYVACKGASSEYAEAINELSTLYLILKEIECEAQDPNSILNRHGRGQHAYLYTAVANIKPTLQELEGLATKYRALGRSDKRTWDRVKFAAEQVADLRAKLSYHITAIGVLRNGISSMAIVRIERILEDIKNDIHLGKRPPTVLSAPTEPSQASVSSRRELATELIEDGISQIEIDSNWEAIVRYLEEPGIPALSVSSQDAAGLYIGEPQSTSQTISTSDDGEGWDSVSQRSRGNRMPLPSIPHFLPVSGSTRDISSNPSQVEEELKLGEMDQKHHGANGGSLQWMVDHLFDHFRLPHPYKTYISSSCLLFPTNVRRIICDCTPRPHILMEQIHLLAGIREGDIIIELPTHSTTKLWVLGITRQGYIGYFYRDWLADLTESDVASVLSHPLDKFRSKEIQDSHARTFPGCPISIFLVEIPAALEIPHILATYWQYTYRCCPGQFNINPYLYGRSFEVNKITGAPPDWFSEHPIPTCIRIVNPIHNRSAHALGHLARRYLEMQVQGDLTGYLQAVVCHIYLESTSEESAKEVESSLNRILVSSMNRPGQQPSEAGFVPYVLYHQGSFDLIPEDHILALFSSYYLHKHHYHGRAKSTRLARYAKLDVSFKDLSSIDASTSRNPVNTPHMDSGNMKFELVSSNNTPSIGKKSMGIHFGREKALAQDFELVKTCIDNFLLAEFGYDTVTTAFVSRQEAYNLVSERRRQAILGKSAQPQSGK
ncbi:hypothetical protein MaudCBS49596_005934 [Microsporum audouinii]